MNSDDNPKALAVLRMKNALRCHAKAKSTGERCRCPAVRGWSVCYVHGARGGAPVGELHGNWKHGLRSRVVRDILGEARALLAVAQVT